MQFFEKYGEESINKKLRYLSLLARQYPTIQAASTEIINLQAILSLPKPTEHFLSDIHGEYEPFIHVLKNASGEIKRKIEDVFGKTLRQSEKETLATLIYYPNEKMELILKSEPNMEDWYKITLHRLVKICREASSKYTRSKVRKALPADFAYIIEELLHEEEKGVNKQEYYTEIIDTIVSIDRAKEFISAICNLIQRLTIDRLHIVGDIFDRGPGADIILDTLMDYHSIDIQWGNHDMAWMGAAAGSEACIANVLRICAKYGNLFTIEQGYGINILPLATFAMEHYNEDPCLCFEPKMSAQKTYNPKEINLIKQMHKAITIIQFKLEGQVIKRNPHYNMNDRLLLEQIDYDNGTIFIKGNNYKLKDYNFPTINPDNPYELTLEEQELIDKLRISFLNSYKLQMHVKFLFVKGNMYLKYNSNLLYHGCIPMNEDRSFKKVKVGSEEYSGKRLLDKIEEVIREAFFNEKELINKQYGIDYMWYLWAGPDSPLFGKDKMATLERYLTDEEELHDEGKSPYFLFRDDEDVANRILIEFGLDPESCHIINGHVPVKFKNGESPIKANGKMIVIDGGFSKAYQKVTGIAGYTLVNSSNGLLLVAHEHFESTQKAIEEEKDILSCVSVVEKNLVRKRVRDTDIGKELEHQVEDLKMLLAAYKSGMLK